MTLSANIKKSTELVDGEESRDQAAVLKITTTAESEMGERLNGKIVDKTSTRSTKSLVQMPMRRSMAGGSLRRPVSSGSHSTRSRIRGSTYSRRLRSSGRGIRPR